MPETTPVFVGLDIHTKTIGVHMPLTGPIKLGRMDERELRIEDHKGPWVRKQVLPLSPD